MQSTIYTVGMFGISKMEVKNLETERKKYAQYENALYVRFIPKGKRKLRQMVLVPSDYILILDGHNHPSPDDGFKQEVEGKTPGIMVKASRYTCYSPEYLTDFENMINPYMEANNLQALEV